MLSAALNRSQLRSSATAYQWQTISWLSLTGLLKIHSHRLCNEQSSHQKSSEYQPQGGTVGLLIIYRLLYLKWPVLALKSPLNPKSPFVHHLLHFLFLSSFRLRSPEASAEPVPPSPGRWSQDLLSGLDRYRKSSFPPKPQMQSYAKHYPFIRRKSIAPLSVASGGITLSYLSRVGYTVSHSALCLTCVFNVCSESNPAKTSGALDLLADDVIVIDTEARRWERDRHVRPSLLASHHYRWRGPSVPAPRGVRFLINPIRLNFDP